MTTATDNAVPQKVNGTRPACPVADAGDDARRFLRLLAEPGGVVEVRAPKVPRRGGRPFPSAGYFADTDAAADAALTLDRRGAAGVYVTLNPPDPALLARSPDRLTDYPEATTADSHVTRRRVLLVDLDPDRPSGIGSTDAEHDAAEAAARRLKDVLGERFGWPAPIVIDSGNGWHLLYRIDLPNDADAATLAAGVLKGLAELHREQGHDGPAVSVDTAVHNASRITKVPGTTARKGHATDDRPHRRSRLVDVPDPVEVVPAERLREVAALAGGTTAANGRAAPKPGTNRMLSRLDVARWLSDRGVAFTLKNGGDAHGRDVYRLAECPFDPDHRSPDAAVFQSPDGKLGAKCLHESCSGRGWQEFKAAIGEPDPDHYDPPLGRRKRARKSDRTSKAGAEPTQTDRGGVRGAGGKLGLDDLDAMQEARRFLEERCTAAETDPENGDVRHHRRLRSHRGGWHSTP